MNQIASRRKRAQKIDCNVKLDDNMFIFWDLDLKYVFVASNYVFKVLLPTWKAQTLTRQ